MRTRTRPSFALLASGSLVALVALAWVGACSNQGEGGVCDINSDDCASGLTCQPITGSPVDRCCPPDRNTSTTQICQQSQTGVADANPPPQDSGSDAEAGSPAPDAVAEAMTETSTDAPVESSSVGAEGTGAEAPDSPTE